jgi:phage baseplate assembly protein W
MSAIVKAAIAEGIADLDRVVDTPVSPFGYGSDISCTTDLDPLMSEVDPFSIDAIRQAILRRLDTPRGQLPDDPNYGLDLKSELNRGVDVNTLRSLAGRLRSEIVKDDRVDSATVRVAPNATGSRITVNIRVVPVDPNLGEFDATLAATSTEVILEAISL